MLWFVSFAVLWSFHYGGGNVVSSCLFFFFKQKTAYEMRISDWSSDVCSSDLENARELEGLGVPKDAIHLASTGSRLLPVLEKTAEEEQIGRASCRERVCQYV